MQKKSKTRRRGAALEEAILRATWDELAAVGYANLSMEGVAARAGTSKPVIYRRWHNRVELVVAAMRLHVPMLSDEVPDTGSLRGDVLTLLQRVSQRISQIGQETLRGLLADYFQLTDSASLWPDVLQIGTDVMMTILTRAAERDEIDLDDISPRIASLPIDLARHELLVNRMPVSVSTLEEIVDQIFIPLVHR